MGTRMGTSGTGREGLSSLADLVRWCSSAPVGTLVPAAELAELLARCAPEEPPDPLSPEEQAEAGWTWRERLWVVPAETRLGTEELAEALGRPRSWIYARTQEKAGADRIPHRKLHGVLTFLAGEVRAWIRDHEETLVAGPIESVAIERRLQVMRGAG